MESLFKTQQMKPKLIKCSCLVCEELFHIEDTYIYDNEYTVCIDCSEINNESHIIKHCKKKVSTINYNYTENIKSVYSIRCKCFQSHQIIIDGLRNIGVQDYINIYCKCQQIKK
jgi:hypothetical protein